MPLAVEGNKSLTTVSGIPVANAPIVVSTCGVSLSVAPNAAELSSSLGYLPGHAIRLASGGVGLSDYATAIPRVC